MSHSIEHQLAEIESLIKKGETNAIRRFDDLAAKYPKEPAIRIAQAHALTGQRDFASAAMAWSHAIAISDNEPHYYYMRGIALFHSGKLLDSVEDFSKVIDLCEQHAWNYYREPAYFFRADAYVKLREFEKACSDCTHVSDGMRTWTDKLKCKADILAECERTRRAKPDRKLKSKL
jgi:tetratricopeptide (TPR) repeat protein